MFMILVYWIMFVDFLFLYRYIMFYLFYFGSIGGVGFVKEGLYFGLDFLLVV